MLKIVIVDDDLNELDNTTKLVNEYCIEGLERKFSVNKFSSPKSFRDFFNDGNRAHIYILDIVMPVIDGIELGTAIRQEHRDAVIIYLTTSPEYGVASYDVMAIDYLLKPCVKERMAKALDRAIGVINLPEVNLFLVRMQDGTYSLPQSKIEYVEYYNHRLIVHTTDGEKIESVSKREPFTSIIEPLVSRNNFVRVSSSFVINMQYVDKVRANKFEMNSGIKIPISRTFQDSRGIFMDYILNRD